MDEDVAGGDKGAQGGLSLFALQIQRDRAFVAVQGDEGGAHLLEVRGLAVLALAIAARFLNLDHICAKIAEGLGRIGAKHKLRQVDNANAVERALGLSLVLGAVRHGVSYHLACLSGAAAPRGFCLVCTKRRAREKRQIH